jgi:hypothetical protein
LTFLFLIVSPKGTHWASQEKLNKWRVFQKMEQLHEQKFSIFEMPPNSAGTIALDNMASEYTPKQKSDQVSWKVLLTK